MTWGGSQSLQIFKIDLIGFYLLLSYILINQRFNMGNLAHNGRHHDPRLRDEGLARSQVVVISDDGSDDGQAEMLSQAVVGDPVEDIKAFVYVVERCD